MSIELLSQVQIVTLAYSLMEDSEDHSEEQ